MSLCSMMGAMQRALNTTRSIDFLAPLAMRFYLAPVMWMAANTKWNPSDPNSSLDSTIQWLGNPDWGLGLPYPYLPTRPSSMGSRVFWCHFPYIRVCCALDINPSYGHNGRCCCHSPLG